MATAAKAASFSLPERPFLFEAGSMSLTVPSGLRWIVIHPNVLFILDVEDSCEAGALFLLSARKRVLGTVEKSPDVARLRRIVRGVFNSPNRVSLFRESDLTCVSATLLVSLRDRLSMEKCVSSRGSDLWLGVSGLAEDSDCVSSLDWRPSLG